MSQKSRPKLCTALRVQPRVVRRGCHLIHLDHLNGRSRAAERLVGVAIRKGQAEGTITTKGVSKFVGTTNLASPYDYADHATLYGDGTVGGNGVYALADDVTDEQFDQARAAPTCSCAATTSAEHPVTRWGRVQG